jgi:MFS transporter, SP family, sugar:H+ symporter
MVLPLCLRPCILLNLLLRFKCLELIHTNHLTSGTVFLKSLNAMDPFTATMIKRAGLVFGCIFVIVFVERIGRRRMCLIVGSLSAVFLLLMGGLGTVQPPQAETQNTILAATIIFPVLYMIGFGST